jgi:hypothetical protein
MRDDSIAKLDEKKKKKVVKPSTLCSLLRGSLLLTDFLLSVPWQRGNIRTIRRGRGNGKTKAGENQLKTKDYVDRLERFRWMSGNPTLSFHWSF